MDGPKLQHILSKADRDKFKFSSGVGFGAANMGGSVNFDYDSKGVKFTGTATFGLDFSVAKELMDREAGVVMGVDNGFKMAFGVGLEAKTIFYAEQIPNNDIDAWFKKQD